MGLEQTEAVTSIAAARRTMARQFAVAGLETPELDARVLLGHALGLDHSGLVAHGDHPLDAAKLREISSLAARRLAGEPVARIVGYKEFWGLRLGLSAATLVPRPDTETVVETALAALDRDGARARPLRLADLGTGSGAILLALLSELPGACGIGTDLSELALATARRNAERLGLANRAAFAACHYGSALWGGFDLVVSNPPYVATADIAALAPEVRHDPSLALDGGPDGLGAYRAIAADAARLLRPGGHLVVELGAGMVAPVVEILHQSGLAGGFTAARDLSGTERALHLRRPG